MNHSNSSISNFNDQWFEVRKLAKRLALFSIPFLLGALTIVLVDPYDFLNFSSMINEDAKFKIAHQLNPCFWKLNKFAQKPNPYVIIGDSRMESMDTDIIKEISGKEYTNLGYGGASSKEIIETFFLISKQIELKEVYINVDLAKYNDYEITNRVELYKNAHENPLIYFVNRGVWEAVYQNLKVSLTNEKFTVGVPDMDRSAFWAEQMKVQKKYYDKYSEPKAYRKEFQKIADFCKENNINLSFIIFPTHTDVQNIIVDSNFTEKSENMRRELVQWGTVYDFDWANELTKNKENFSDPIHANSAIKRTIAESIWGNDRRFVKVLAQ